ncbi:MAG: penicillin-binding transpeptidase domain-containing protein [Candidatus Methylomirabilis sp.]|nr:penicillin-binding transpeptidase domain-containing protein [Candidatus Methylomirabilis sp.]
MRWLVRPEPLKRSIGPPAVTPRQKVVASFVGFVPVERPQLAIIVIIDEPATLRWGGSIAAPTFREIARESLKHLEKESGRSGAVPVGGRDSSCGFST